MTYKTTCRRCGETVEFVINTEPDYDFWVRLARHLDHQELTCPGGGHTEKGGWRLIWSLDYLIATLFPEHRPIYQALYLHEQASPTIAGLLPLPDPLPVAPEDDWETNYDS